MAAIAIVLALVAVALNFVVAGPAGAAGKDGTNGTNGTSGTNGINGAPGTNGINGKDGSNGKNGTDGVNGLPGTNFTINTTLEPGQSETGLYSVFGSNASGIISTLVSFRIPLPAVMSGDNTTMIRAGSGYTSDCPGPGEAAKGQLCVYEYSGGNAIEPIFSNYFYNPMDGSYSISVWGFGIGFDATDATAWSYGSWTVTE